MKLRPRMLLIFATTMAAGISVMYFFSRQLLLANFLQLENEQMQEDVSNASDSLHDQYRSRGVTTNDYANWDVAYEFMTDPAHKDIGKEFQNGQMDGLGLHLIVFRDLQGNIVFSKAYDDRLHKEVAVPTDFLKDVFSHRLLRPENIVRILRDGLYNSRTALTLYRTTDVKSAVTRLGVSVLQDLVLSVAVFRAFTANEHISREYIEDLHRHAQLTARIGSGMTRNTPWISACTLAALLHDIGKLVIAERLPAHLARTLRG